MIIFNEARNGSFVIPFSNPITKIGDVRHIPFNRNKKCVISVGHSINQDGQNRIYVVI